MTKRIILEYCEEGKPVSDFQINKWSKNLIEKFNESDRSIQIKISNESLIYYSRFLIISGKIKYNQLVFKFNNKLLHLNEFCAFIEPLPDGFLNLYSESIFKISKHAIDLRKRKKENKGSKKNG